jgi:hypothetical protein
MVNVGANQADITTIVQVCAYLNDKVTQAKSECKSFSIELFKVSVIEFATPTSSYEMEKIGQEAITELSIASNMLPTFVQLQFSGNTL